MVDYVSDHVLLVRISDHEIIRRFVYDVENVKFLFLVYLHVCALSLNVHRV